MIAQTFKIILVLHTLDLDHQLKDWNERLFTRGFLCESVCSRQSVNKAVALKHPTSKTIRLECLCRMRLPAPRFGISINKYTKPHTNPPDDEWSPTTNKKTTKVHRIKTLDETLIQVQIDENLFTIATKPENQKYFTINLSALQECCSFVKVCTSGSSSRLEKKIPCNWYLNFSEKKDIFSSIKAPPTKQSKNYVYQASPVIQLAKR